MAVVNNLKEIRKERSLNQKDLAEAAGTCERTISRIERCERNPSLEMALRLSAYLGLAVEEVFSYQTQPFHCFLYLLESDQVLSILRYTFLD